MYIGNSPIYFKIQSASYVFLLTKRRQRWLYPKGRVSSLSVATPPLLGGTAIEAPLDERLDSAFIAIKAF